MLTDPQLQQFKDDLAAARPADAAELLRVAVANGQRDSRLLLALAERALDGASGAGREVLQKYAEAFRQGRRIGFMPAVVLQEGETAALVADVESAFQQEKD